MKNAIEYYFRIFLSDFKPAYEIFLKVKDYLVKGVC
jgi:hypothetical protein